MAVGTDVAAGMGVPVGTDVPVGSGSDVAVGRVAEGTAVVGEGKGTTVLFRVGVGTEMGSVVGVDGGDAIVAAGVTGWDVAPVVDWG